VRCHVLCALHCTFVPVIMVHVCTCIKIREKIGRSHCKKQLIVKTSKEKIYKSLNLLISSKVYVAYALLQTVNTSVNLNKST
jgi:hypothetical protein